jgi:uncharacterized membrane protein
VVKKIKQNPPSQSNSAPVAKQQEQTITQVAFTGPIPHPSVLQEYNDVLPGLAERIVTMAEAEATHRHEMDREVARQNELIIKEEFCERRIGQFLGLGIAVLTISAAIFAIAHGAEKAAMVIGGATVVGLATVFVVGRIKKEPISTQPDQK